MNKIIKNNQIFEFSIIFLISFLITSFSIRYVTLSLSYFLGENSVLSFFNQKNILFPNSRVFTAENNKYSALLGSNIKIKIIQNNGEIIYLDSVYVNNFNHAYNKILSNVTLQDFSQSSTTSSIRKEEVVIALLCNKDSNYIDIERNLVKHSKDMNRKFFNNKVKCN